MNVTVKVRGFGLCIAVSQSLLGKRFRLLCLPSREAGLPGLPSQAEFGKEQNLGILNISDFEIGNVGRQKMVSRPHWLRLQNSNFFLVPTVLRENPYLVSRGKIGMHSHAGAVGTRKTVIFDLCITMRALLGKEQTCSPYAASAEYGAGMASKAPDCASSIRATQLNFHLPGR